MERSRRASNRKSNLITFVFRIQQTITRVCSRTNNYFVALSCMSVSPFLLRGLKINCTHIQAVFFIHLRSPCALTYQLNKGADAFLECTLFVLLVNGFVSNGNWRKEAKHCVSHFLSTIAIKCLSSSLTISISSNIALLPASILLFIDARYRGSDPTRTAISIYCSGVAAMQSMTPIRL